jgi:hypothetical protein
MTDIEKLRVLLPHWREHNAEHATEFREWAAKAEAAQEDILTAARHVEAANEALESALAKLGGPLPGGHHH